MSSAPQFRWWIRRTALVAAGLALVCGQRARADEGTAEVENLRARLAEAERVEGPESGAAAEAIGVLVDSLRRGDKRTAAEARQLAERAVSILEKAHGAEALELLPALRRLGQVLMEAGEYRAARPVLERAVSLRAAIRTQTVLSSGGARTNLASLAGSGDFARARDLLERALATQEAALGPTMKMSRGPDFSRKRLTTTRLRRGARRYDGRSRSGSASRTTALARRRPCTTSVGSSCDRDYAQAVVPRGTLHHGRTRAARPARGATPRTSCQRALGLGELADARACSSARSRSTK